MWTFGISDSYFKQGHSFNWASTFLYKNFNFLTDPKSFTTNELK